MRVVPRESHLFPRHESAGELLDAAEATREADPPGDSLGQLLDELQLVGTDRAPQHVQGERGGGGEQRAEGGSGAGRKA